MGLWWGWGWVAWRAGACREGRRRLRGEGEEGMWAGGVHGSQPASAAPGGQGRGGWAAGGWEGMCACVRVARALIEAGADVHAKNYEGVPQQHVHPVQNMYTC